MPKITETACRNAQPDAKTWEAEIKGFALFARRVRPVREQDPQDFLLPARRERQNRSRQDRHLAGDQRNTGPHRGDIACSGPRVGKVAKGPLAARTPTLKEALASYIVRPKLRSELNREIVKGQMHVNLKAWLDTPLDLIDRAICARAHARLTVPREGKDVKERARIVGGERAANHTMKTIRSIWNHVRRSYDLPECPTIAIEWHDEDPPKTVIEDFAEWKKAVNTLENSVHQAFCRFLLFTGLRKSKAMTLRWDQVFDDHLHLPMTKNGRAFDLPPLPALHEILAPMEAYRSDFVFHGKRQAEHLASPADIPWSPHTHRCTFATVAENKAGLLKETVGRLLNNTPTSVMRGIAFGI